MGLIASHGRARAPGADMRMKVDNRPSPHGSDGTHHTKSSDPGRGQGSGQLCRAGGDGGGTRGKHREDHQWGMKSGSSGTLAAQNPSCH
jgi:hypothetical protein